MTKRLLFLILLSGCAPKAPISYIDSSPAYFCRDNAGTALLVCQTLAECKRQCESAAIFAKHGPTHLTYAYGVKWPAR